MFGPTTTKSIALDVSGASQLRLVTTITGDNGAYDHSDWANASLSPSG